MAFVALAAALGVQGDDSGGWYKVVEAGTNADGILVVHGPIGQHGVNLNQRNIVETVSACCCNSSMSCLVPDTEAPPFRCRRVMREKFVGGGHCRDGDDRREEYYHKQPASFQSNWPAIVASMISVIAILLTWIAGRRARKLQFLGYLQKDYDDLQAWGQEVVHAMANAVMLCDLNPGKTQEPSYFERRHKLRTKLSALLDIGRWLLPNEDHTSFGVHKQLAFRGHRQRALNEVAETLNLVESLNYSDQPKNMEKRDQLVKSKREFVSDASPMRKGQEQTERIPL